MFTNNSNKVRSINYEFRVFHKVRRICELSAVWAERVSPDFAATVTAFSCVLIYAG